MQAVKGDDGKLSQVRFTIRGCPQGSIMGPWCFKIYINDLPKVVRNSLCIIFADDTQLIIAGPVHTLPQLISKLKSDLIAILDWMDNNGMTLNLGKTQLILIGSTSNLSKVGVVEFEVNITIKYYY